MGDESHNHKFGTTIIMKGNLKKRNRFGFFYKRSVTLTDEPKFYYRKMNELTKEIVLHPDTIKLERLDKTKFKILEASK
jgi:hypothetical protein